MMVDRWEPMREYFRSRQGQKVNFSYVNAKGIAGRGFGVVKMTLDAHVLLVTKTARGYASFDFCRMPELMERFGIEINNELQAGFSPSCGGESDVERVEI